MCQSLFLRTPFLTEHLRWLLRIIISYVLLRSKMFTAGLQMLKHHAFSSEIISFPNECKRPLI